jgi:PAS domain S-box-containing protein
MGHTRAALVILGLVAAPGAPANPSGPINVLVMHWYDRGYFANAAFDRTLEAALHASAPEGVEYYSEYLETNRFPGEDQARLLSAYLRQKYEGKRIDVIISGISQTLDFLLEYRHELFPKTPIVFATERPVEEAVLLDAEATGFTFGNAYAKTLNLALQWHPGAKQLFVVSGTLDHDRALEPIIRDDLRPYESTIAITYLTDLAPDQLAARIRTLPKDSLILYVWQQALDAQGRVMETQDVLARVAKEAKVPIYGRSPAMIGRGIIGGYVWTQESNAAKLADLTMRVVNGTRPKDIPIGKAPDTPMFDWLQLQRWRIDEDSLPPGSVVRFREPTMWQQYKRRIVGTIAVVLLQALLIGALLVQRRRAQRVQRVLQESEERFRNMADTTAALISVFGPDQRCTFLNRAWLTFTGREMEQELGAGWMECVHPDDRDRVSRACSSALDTLVPFKLEYRLRRADGEYRTLLCTGAPRFHKDNVFAGYIESCVDITDLKQAQERILAGQKLELMGTLANGVAHDFNNLLGGILASAELALTELGEDSHCAEELLQIQAAADLGARIVRELMIFGGKDTPAFGPLDCALLIREMSQVLKVSLSKSTILKTELAGGLGMVCGNPAQLQQLIMNLVVNAAQAIGDREGEICVRATMLTAEQRLAFGPATSLPHHEYVQLEVADTGPGISDEVKARIFDPFFTTKLAGRGLGLAVAQAVVRAHDGIVRVVSVPGRGTTFQVLLPCLPKRTASDEGAEDESSTAWGAAAEQPLEPRTVLIIEDEKVLRLSVATMLRRRGFTVIEAADGNTGVDLFVADRQRIDSVLLDVTLPGKTGQMVLEEIQRIEPEVKVIVTSAYGEEHVQKLLHGLRVSGYLQKPYRLAQVENVLQSCFSETGTTGLPGA